MKLVARVDQVACIECGACVNSCPTNAIEIETSGKARVSYEEDCEACFLCVIDCPVQAISVIRA